METQATIDLTHSFSPLLNCRLKPLMEIFLTASKAG